MIFNFQAKGYACYEKTWFNISYCILPFFIIQIRYNFRRSFLEIFYRICFQIHFLLYATICVFNS